MNSQEAKGARLHWRRFLPLSIRISMIQTLPAWPWLAGWLVPERRQSVADRVAMAKELIDRGNEMAEWIAPEIRDISPR